MRFRTGPFLRGLALGLALSGVNLVGVFATLLLAGGLAGWSGTQFIGVFGVLEIATGFAFVICPNIWQLPVLEARGQAPGGVRLAASTVLIPHWPGGVKAIAGLGFVAWSSAHEGVSLATPGLALVVASLGAVALGTSLLAARFGVFRPGLDVFEVTIRRPGHVPYELPGISLGAAWVQLLLSILTFPTIKTFSPGILYGPAMAPSLPLLAWTTAAAVVALTAGFAAWRGRLAWRASPAQQRAADSLAGRD